MTKFAALAVLATLALATVGHAQINPFQGNGPRPDSADMAMMTDAAQQLYGATPPARNGAFRTWSNTKTGSSGKVTLLSSFHSEGLACRKVGYDIKLKTRPDVRHYTLNWCKTANGDWKIL
jgi:surface antigen